MTPLRKKLYTASWITYAVAIAATAAGVALACWDHVGICGKLFHNQFLTIHRACPEHALETLPTGLGLLFLGGLIMGSSIIALLSLQGTKATLGWLFVGAGIGAIAIAIAIYPVEGYSLAEDIDKQGYLMISTRHTHVFAIGALVGGVLSSIAGLVLVRRSRNAVNESARG